MTKRFIREARYVVMKLKDMRAANLTEQEIDAFNRVCDRVCLARAQRGKKPFECVVVEADWPEYETVWAMIEERMLKHDRH